MLTAYRIQALLRTQPLERLFVGESNHDSTQRVLIRRLLPGAPDAEKAETAAVFQQHLERLSCLTHPDTLPVHEYACGESGPFVVATDVPTGATLTELIESKGTFSSEVTASLGLAIANRLAHAHELSIVHGALSPQSVLINTQGNVALMDLGLAPMYLERLSARLQRFPAAWNAVFPIPGAVSPEVLKGELPTIQTDVYGLGVLMYTLLTGRTPFEGTAVLTQNAILLGTVPIQTSDAVSGVDDVLAGIIDRCLERAPEKRPADIMEVVSMLEPLAQPMSTVLDTIRAHAHSQLYVDRFESRLRVVDPAIASVDVPNPPSVAYLFSENDAPASEKELLNQLTPEQRQLFMRMTAQNSLRAEDRRGKVRFQIRRGMVLGAIVGVVAVMILWPSWMDESEEPTTSYRPTPVPMVAPNSEIVPNNSLEAMEQKTPIRSEEKVDGRPWRRPLEIRAEPVPIEGDEPLPDAPRTTDRSEKPSTH